MKLVKKGTGPLLAWCRVRLGILWRCLVVTQLEGSGIRVFFFLLSCCNWKFYGIRMEMENNMIKL